MYVAMPLGSSSDAPVIRPGPSMLNSRGFDDPTTGDCSASSNSAVSVIEVPEYSHFSPARPAPHAPTRQVNYRFLPVNGSALTSVWLACLDLSFFRVQHFQA